MFFAMAPAFVAPAPAAAAATALRAGVREIAAPGVPGGLAAFGDRAFPVVAGRSGDAEEPVVAALQAGAGRVVAFGHDGYLRPEHLETADTGRLMQNAIRWAGRGAAGRVAVVDEPELRMWLRTQNFDAAAGNPADLSGARVLVISGHKMTPEHVEPLRRFLRRGGGLILAATGWGWSWGSADADLANDFPGNRLLAPFGLVWTSVHLDRTSERGFAASAPPAWAHAGRALEIVSDFLGGGAGACGQEATRAAAVLTHAVAALPRGDTLLLPGLRALRARRPGDIVPTPRRPVTKNDLAARLLLALDIHAARGLPAEQVRAHPAGSVFPGEVAPPATPITRAVAVDTGVPGWHSLGLYAPPGTLVTVRLPEGASGKGLAVRIGCHTDTLWHLDRWERAPEITRVWPLGVGETRVASPFGGLLYVVVPEDAAPGTVPITLRGAVEAPLYVRGKTDPVEWRERLRRLPAPWAEVGSDKIVLTVPARAIRDLEDPEALMRFWDAGMDAIADLAALPRARRRPERIVADVQISAGYMHSGYPIMTFLDVERRTVDVAALRQDSWGHWHELGHNHQAPDWTFAGTGEVTNNLFALYVLETVAGLPVAKMHPNLAPDRLQKAVADHLAGGAKFEDWKRKPFTALAMYLQLKDAFGWDAFKKVFAEYRALPPGERPRTDDEKRDQWMIRFGRAVGRDLGPFFAAWGVPTSAAARRTLADLPVWMPEGFPTPLTSFSSPAGGRGGPGAGPPPASREPWGGRSIGPPLPPAGEGKGVRG